MTDMVLRSEMNLPNEVRKITGLDGISCLEFTSAMATFYRMTYGELTPFFQALVDGRLIGSRCGDCGTVMVPAVTWHCPNCGFAEMTEIELPQRGRLAFTAPITAFPSTYFIGHAPFCRGYVDVAETEPRSFLPSRLRTLTGLPRPGIFVQGVELKVVFKDHRQGRITDILWVPMDEVADELRDVEPLLASRLTFESPEEPEVEVRDELKSTLQSVISALQELADSVARSPRAQKDIADRTLRVAARTGGGDLYLAIEDGRMIVGEDPTDSVDFTMVVDDPAVFTDWTQDGSLTDAQVEGRLWLPDQEAFSVLPFLDRLPRSIRRDRQEGRLD